MSGAVVNPFEREIVLRYEIWDGGPWGGGEGSVPGFKDGWASMLIKEHSC